MKHSILLALLSLGSPLIAQGRLDDAARFGAAPRASSLLAGTVCDESVAAYHRLPGPEGGTLHLGAYFTPSMVGPADTVAFYARVDGLDRNQGVFVSDASGVRAIALGSGGGMGSGVPGPAVGDSTPIGGRFTGFPAVAPAPRNPWPPGATLLLGDAFVPSINANGDVAFIADVQGGSAQRGLFLYRAATQQIEKIAAFGDALPGGAVLTAFSHASLNDAGDVVFLAYAPSVAQEAVVRWSAGVLSVVARAGDPAPTPGEVYGTFGGACSYGFPDGTSLIVCYLPDINNRGTVSFACATTPTGYHGAIVDRGGSAQWYAQWGDSAPGGGEFQVFYDIILNNEDEIAFCCEYSPNPPQRNPAWFVGKPGAFRKVLEVGDVLPSGQRVLILAASHNPMNPLSDDGDLALWVDTGVVGSSPTQDVLVLGRADGSLATLFTEGDPSRLGTSRHFSPWPSLNAGGQLSFSHGLAAAPGGVDSAHLLFDLCPEVRTYCTAGTSSAGCTPLLVHSGVPSATAPNGFTVTASGLDGQKLTILFYGISGTAALPYGSSTLCVQPPLQRTIPSVSSGTAGQCDGDYAIDLNAYFAADPSSLGQPVYPGQAFAAQVWSRDAQGSVLSDGIEFWLGP